MSTLLAVDGSSVFMRALSVLPEDKRTVDDLEYMTVGMLRKAVRLSGATHLVVALDSTEPCWRCEIHPEYKADRKYSDLRPKQLTPMLLPRLKARRIATAYNRKAEADDLLNTLAHTLRPGHTMQCYTRDSDLYALASCEGVTLLWPEKGGTLLALDRMAVESRLGYSADWAVKIRALTADTKDNLRALLKGGRVKGWRCPLTTPRAVELMRLYEGDLWEILDQAVRGAGFGMKPAEHEYINEQADAIAVMWHVATLLKDVTLNVEAPLTRVAGMNLNAPHVQDD